LTEEIANLNQHIEDTQAYIVTATNDRQLAHDDYLNTVEEHNGAINAIIEALGLLDSINNSDDEVSFAQVGQVKRHVDKIQKKLTGKNVDTALIQALLSLSSEEFANTDALQKVEDLLVQVKINLENSLDLENKNEEQAQANFSVDMDRANLDIAESSSQVSEKSELLSQTEENIVSSQEFVEERTADRISYQGDLDAENEAFQIATDNYNALVAQFQSELEACNEALTVIQGLTLEDYIQGRVDNKAGVIDQPHGQRFGLNDD